MALGANATARRVTIAALVFLSGMSASNAQRDDRGLDDESIARWKSFYQIVANDYSMAADGVDLVVSPEPVFNFVYPYQFRKAHGSFFVWTHHRRPYAVGCMWSQLERSGRRTLVHEFHSLSRRPLTATWRDRVKWTPSSSGIEFHDVKDAPRVADTAALRRIQMRSLARQFDGFTHREKARPLRVLSQALYAYESPQLDIPSGGLFALLDEQDVEIILWLEAQAKDETLVWRYAPVPFSEAELTLRHDGLEVWTDPGRGYADPTMPFYSPRPSRHQPDLSDVQLPGDVEK